MRKWLVVLLLLVGSVAGADDRSEVLAAAKQWGTLSNLRIAAPYAMVDWSQSEGAGQALYRKVDGKWWILTGGGGVIDGNNLWQYGVPAAARATLLANPELAKVTENGPYWTWMTVKRDTTDDLLEGLSAFEMTLARNEVFATHGRIFKDPVLAGYFKSRPWYRPNPGYTDALLTAREKRNVNFIGQYQKRKGKEF